MLERKKKLVKTLIDSLRSGGNNPFIRKQSTTVIVKGGEGLKEGEKRGREKNKEEEGGGEREKRRENIMPPGIS